MDRLTSLSVFLAAARLGSFSAAARELGMSPQMARKHVGSLEQQMGGPFFNRSTRHLSLTDAGEALVIGAGQTLDAAKRMADAVEACSTLPRGKVRVTAPVALGVQAVTPAVPEFLRRYPEIDLELVLLDRTVDLIAEGFDVAVRIGALVDSELTAKRLAPFAVGAYASPDYLERAGRPAHPNDLREHRCLRYIFDSHPSPDLWVLRNGDETIRVDSPKPFRTNETTSLIDLAVRGTGIIMTGEVNVRAHLQTGQLVRVLPDYDGPTRPIHVLFHGKTAVPPRIRCAIDWLTETLG